MQPAAYAGLLGNASLLTATYGKNRYRVELRVRFGARDACRIRWGDHNNDDPGIL